VSDPTAHFDARRAKLLEDLRKLQDKELDGEYTHLQADELLLNFIRDEEIREAYSKIVRWYA
jgi:hypothetical protein